MHIFILFYHSLISFQTLTKLFFMRFWTLFPLITGIFLCFLTQNTAQIVAQMPPLQVEKNAGISPGYIFITPTVLDTAGPFPTSLAILDSAGNYLFFKPFTQKIVPPYKPVGASDFKLQPSGFMSFSAPLASGESGMYLLNSQFEIVDSVKCGNGFATDGHDLVHLPDGRFIISGLEDRIMNLSTMFTQGFMQGSPAATVTGNIVQELDAQKNVLFEWKSLDHYALTDVYRHFFTDPAYLDHSHINSIEVDHDGNYILSFRHIHEVTKIDAVTGDIIWRFGGKNNQFTFIGDTMPFSAQHDARRLPNGHITLFDNGAYNSTPRARAIEYELDEVNKTAKAVWQTSEPASLSSRFIGSTQRLSNGNTLIDWGGVFPLPQNTDFTEVDSVGNTVLEINFGPPRYISYRALKYQLPFDLQRPEVVCTGPGVTLAAPSGYDRYEWNTGATTQSITVADTGFYQVWVNRGIGFISSVPYRVTDLSLDCTSGTETIGEVLELSIYPNPVSDQMRVGFGTRFVNQKFRILNVLGKTVLEDRLNETQTIEMTTLSPGIYVLMVNTDNGLISRTFEKL